MLRRMSTQVGGQQEANDAVVESLTVRASRAGSKRFEFAFGGVICTRIPSPEPFKHTPIITSFCGSQTLVKR